MRGVQLSFFGADAQPAAVADLEGLLAGPAHLVRGAGGVRLSVVLPAPAGAPSWRVDALTDAFAARGLHPEVAATVDGLAAVRTGFTPALVPIAVAWTRGAVTAPPVGFALDGGRLRLWALAAGRREPAGYLLGLGDNDPEEYGGAPVDPWLRVAVALRAAGVAGTALGRRGGGPAYRFAGGRRLVRLRELVGDPPRGAGRDWPG